MPRTWDESFALLVEYKRRNGHTNVIRSDPGLGIWVNCQRQAYSRKQRGIEAIPGGRRWISDEHEERLNEIGFQWDCCQGDQSNNNGGQEIIVIDATDDSEEEEEDHEDEEEEAPMVLRISYSPTDGTAAILSSSSSSSSSSTNNVANNDPHHQRQPRRRMGGEGQNGQHETTNAVVAAPAHRTGRTWDESFQLLDGEETSQEDNQESRASPAAKEEESFRTPSNHASSSGASAMNSGSSNSSGSVAKSSSSFPLYYADLVEYQKENGDCNVPQSYPRLGPFVNRMRVAYWRKQRREENMKRGGFRITQSQIEQLNNLGFEWIGTKAGQIGKGEMPMSEQQQDESSRPEPKQAGERAVVFGNMSRSSAAMTVVTAPNNNKRKRATTMMTTTTTAKIARTNDSWENMFQRFLRYYRLTGMGFVRCSIEFEGEPLGKWSSRQRSLARHQDTSRLSVERMNRLTMAGFVWNETSSTTGTAMTNAKSQNHGRVGRKLLAQKSANVGRPTSNRKKAPTSSIALDQYSGRDEQEDETAMPMPSAGGRKMAASKSIAGSIQAPSAQFSPQRGSTDTAQELPHSTTGQEESRGDLPGKKDRRKMLKHYLREQEHGHAITKDELRSLVKSTKGWSGSDIKRLANEASLGPAREYLKDSRKRRRQLRLTGGTLPVSGGGDREGVDFALGALRPVAMPDFEKAFAAGVGPTSS